MGDVVTSISRTTRKELARFCAHVFLEGGSHRPEEELLVLHELNLPIHNLEDSMKLGDGLPLGVRERPWRRFLRSVRLQGILQTIRGLQKSNESRNSRGVEVDLDLDGWPVHQK